MGIEKYFSLNARYDIPCTNQLIHVWYANYVMLDWMTSCSVVRTLTDILLERALDPDTTVTAMKECLVFRMKLHCDTTYALYHHSSGSLPRIRRPVMLRAGPRDDVLCHWLRGAPCRVLRRLVRLYALCCTKA